MLYQLSYAHQRDTYPHRHYFAALLPCQSERMVRSRAPNPVLAPIVGKAKGQNTSKVLLISRL